MNDTHSFSGRLRFVVGMTLILWVISERVFWSFWRSDEVLLWTAVTLVAYFVATYALCLCLYYFRVSTVPGLLLCGAIYGWLTEGVVAMTMFGFAGIPLPFSISWTGLAWHMLISVYLVLWLGHRQITKGFMGGTLFSGVLGLAWGLWSMTWFFEEPPLATSAEAFLVHALIVTFLMGVGFWLMGRGGRQFVPTKREYVVVGGIVGLFSLVITLPTVTILFPILLTALLLTGWALHRERRRYKSEPLLLDTLQTATRPRALLALLIAPLLASGIYAASLAGILPTLPTNVAVMIITTLLGFVVYSLAWLKIYRGK